MITYKDFERVNIRVGRIIDVQDFPEARNPSYRLKIDFGAEIGIKKSCARITRYGKEELLGRKIVAVVNFPPKQIANSVSEVLVLGTPGKDGKVIILDPSENAVTGNEVF